MVSLLDTAEEWYWGVEMREPMVDILRVGSSRKMGFLESNVQYICCVRAMRESARKGRNGIAV